MQNLELEHSLTVNIDRSRDAKSKVGLRGEFKVEILSVDGTVREMSFKNDIVNEGKNYILDAMFSDATQIPASSWFIGLISNSAYSALAAGDTMASHAGWAEFTGYSQSTRVAWGPGNPSTQSITNGTPATFDLNATGTLKGVFIASNSVKAGTSGILWATALFAADVPVTNGDQIKITYTVSS